MLWSWYDNLVGGCRFWTSDLTPCIKHYHTGRLPIHSEHSTVLYKIRLRKRTQENTSKLTTRRHQLPMPKHASAPSIRYKCHSSPVTAILVLLYQQRKLLHISHLLPLLPSFPPFQMQTPLQAYSTVSTSQTRSGNLRRTAATFPLA